MVMHPKSKSDAKNAKKSENESMGFPNIEKLIEEKMPDLSGFNARLQELETMAKESVDKTARGAAEKAGKAYSQFLKLYDGLIEVKEEMQKDRKGG